MFCAVVSSFVKTLLHISLKQEDSCSSESSENLNLLSGSFLLKRWDFHSSENILTQAKIALELDLPSGSFSLKREDSHSS